MKRQLALMLMLFSTLTTAQTLKISFEEICAFEDDGVMETVDFVLAADSEYIRSAYSQKIALHPGKCFRKPEVLKKYAMDLPVYTTGEPLRLQLAAKGLLFLRLGQQKVFLGEQDQLNKVKEVENATLFLTQDLYKEDKVIELTTKYAKVKARLHLTPPSGTK